MLWSSATFDNGLVEFDPEALDEVHAEAASPSAIKSAANLCFAAAIRSPLPPVLSLGVRPGVSTLILGAEATVCHLSLHSVGAFDQGCRHVRGGPSPARGPCSQRRVPFL